MKLVLAFFCRLIQWTHDWKLANWPSYSLFINLLDNYNPTNNEPEPEHTAEELGEMDMFLDTLLNYRDVIKILKDLFLLKSKSIVDWTKTPCTKGSIHC